MVPRRATIMGHLIMVQVRAMALSAILLMIAEVMVLRAVQLMVGIMVRKVIQIMEAEVAHTEAMAQTMAAAPEWAAILVIRVLQRKAHKVNPGKEVMAIIQI